MKKVFGVIALAAVLCCGFTSCDDAACYVVTQKTEVLGQTLETKVYVWGTADEVNTYIDNAKKVAAVKSVTKKRVNRAQSDCIGAAN